MQDLLSRACWDADGVRDDVRGYVVEYLGGPDRMLVVDETGDVKKGMATAGVQRQYTGTVGRVENAQVAVYLTYAGRARLDRPVYLVVVLIAEELLLLALDEKGRLGLGSGARLKHALTGALLAELAIDGCLTITPDGSVHPTATSPGDALLAQVHGEACHLAGEHAQGAVRDIGVFGGYRQDVICRLVNAGVLGRRRAALGRTRYPVLDAAVHQAALNAARSAMNAWEPMTPRIAVILALAGTCGLARQVAPDRGSRGEVRKRMSRATAEAPFAPEVARTIDTLVAAVHALTAAAGGV